MQFAVVTPVVMKRGGQDTVGGDGMVGFDLALQRGTEMFDVLRAGIGWDGQMKRCAVAAARGPDRGEIVGQAQTMGAGDFQVLRGGRGLGAKSGGCHTRAQA